MIEPLLTVFGIHHRLIVVINFSNLPDFFISLCLSRSSSGYVDPVDDSENLNPEDIHQSLRSTANAIQNYTFDSAVTGSSGASMTPASKAGLDSSSSASSLSKGESSSAVDGGLPDGKLINNFNTRKEGLQ